MSPTGGDAERIEASKGETRSDLVLMCAHSYPQQALLSGMGGIVGDLLH